MPILTIGVVSSLDHEEAHRVSRFNRVVVLDGKAPPRFGDAMVSRPPSVGGIHVQRGNGIATVVASGVSESKIRRAVLQTPDPVLIVVLPKAPGAALRRALSSRSATVVLPANGSVTKLVATNEVSGVGVEVTELVPGVEPKPKTKAKGSE